MANTDYYIDTDVVGGLNDGTSWANAYSTFADFVTNRQGAILTGDTITANCRGSADDVLTAQLDFGLFTGAGKLIIKGDSTINYQWQSDKYILQLVSSFAPTSLSGCVDLRFEDFQIYSPRSGANTAILHENNSNTPGDIEFIRSKGKFSATTSSTTGFIYLGYTVGTPVITADDSFVFGDCGYLVYSSFMVCTMNWTNSYGAANNEAFRLQNGSTGTVTDSAIELTGTGVLANKAQPTFTNCATDSGAGTNPVTVSNWSLEFVDRANGDVKLTGSSQLISAGTGNTNIGPDQVTAAGPTIQNIDGDNEVYQGQTPVTINCANTPASVASWNADINGNSLTTISWNSGNPQVTIPGGTPLISNGTLTVNYTE